MRRIITVMCMFVAGIASGCSTASDKERNVSFEVRDVPDSTSLQSMKDDTLVRLCGRLDAEFSKGPVVVVTATGPVRIELRNSATRM
jgi:hypothetical protein